MLAATLAGCCTLFAQAPSPNFTASPVSGCSPLIVVFQNQTQGPVTSYLWDFGNGNTSTLQNPTATYFTPGSYTVKLTATNASGSNTLTRAQFITVYETPNANFTANVTSGCFPLRVQLTDLSTAGAGNSITSWQWDFGNGITSTLQNPVAVYTTSGNFSVTLKVTNDKGCVKTFTRANYIHVNPGVDASFNFSTPNVCRAPATINFTNNSTGPPPLSYYWSFGDGNTSTQASPSHTYTANGSFTVMLVASSGAGCIDTVYSPVVIGGFNTAVSAPDSACYNIPVSFINNSTPAPVSSLWNFGDGSTASSLNATHTFTTPGIYQVWLYNTYSSCVDSVLHTIYISPKPPVDYTAPVTTKCQPPLTVNFQDLTPAAVAWFWDFGDGATSTQQNPSHTYTNYGSFTVKLIVTNSSGCIDSLVRPGYVRIQRPVISLPQLPERGCIPYTTTFNPSIVSLDAVTSYQWDFGDGGTSTSPNPTHTYTVLGTYDVRLIITTSTGCRDTLTVVDGIKVGTKPVANFTAQPVPVCGRQPVYFTDLSIPADEWLWDFGDGSTSTAQHPMHSYEDTGYFNVTLVAYNSGCADTLVRSSYTHVLPPIARFRPVANCNDRLEFTFTDLSIAPQSWRWDFGDGGTSTIQNPVHRFPALGSYNVRLIVTNGNCADTLTLAVHAIDENPDFSSTQVTGCKPAPFSFTATNIAVSLVRNYYWDFGDGSVDSTDSPSTSHTYTSAGYYTVKLVTIDLNGCMDSITKNNYIRVNGPLAGFSATNNTGCVGLVVTFNDQSTTDGLNAITNWTWDFGDGTVQNFTSPPFQHTYTTLDTFDVKLTVTDAAGCIDTIRVNDLVITSDPQPGFVTIDTLTCPGGPVRFYNQSVPSSVTSFWDFGDGGTSTAQEPVHNYADTGYYTVKLYITDSLGCVDSITRTNYIHVVRPVAGFTVSDSVGSCIPLQVDFTNTSSNYVWSLWDFGPGEGTSSSTNPSHYFSTPGNFQVKLLVTTHGGCSDSAYRNIIVFDTSGSRMDYLPIGGCRPLPVTLNAFTNGPIASYFWDYGDGYTETTTTPNSSHVYMSYGNYLPKIIMEDPAGCLIPVQGIDTVLVIGAEAKFGLDRSVFCDSGTVQFIDSTTYNDQVATYTWNFGDGATSNLTAPSHTYTSPGLYPVSLEVGTVSGCLDTAYFNYVKVVQSPLIDIAGDSVICVNSFATHSGIFIQPDTSVVNWAWNFPNGNISGVQNPPPQPYIQPGNFVISTTAINSTGCSTTSNMNLRVNPLPSVTMPGQLTVQAGFPVQVPATYSPNTVSWNWSPATGLSCSNCPSPMAGPNLTTLYQVQFTDSNGCVNSGSIEVIVICKNANVFLPNTFSPNGDGSNDVFYPRGRGLERAKLLRIFNRWGEIVFEKKDFPINDASAGWNGSYKGQRPHPDVYVYQAEFFCTNGDVIMINGNIALIL